MKSEYNKDLDFIAHPGFFKVATDKNLKRMKSI
jgi:hypothetical protein